MADDNVVIVSNISPQLEEHHLKELFECCGTITSMGLNKALGQCTIYFQEATHAKAAVFLSGTTLGDRPLAVQQKQAIAAPPPSQSPWASGVPPPNLGPTSGGLIPNPAFGSGVDPAANDKKLEEINRTVYIGNVNCDLNEGQLVEFFTQQCGPIVIVKMAGETLGKPSRFAFVEFQDPFAAQKALAMDGQPLAGLPLKIRKANNAILKPTAPAHAAAAPKDVSAIMAKVMAHTQSLGSKLDVRDRSRSRDRDRGRRDRDRDRDRDRRSRRRRSRSRSRSRDRRSSRGGNNNDDRRCYNCGGRGHISRNCTKSRSRSPGRRAGGGGGKAAQVADDHAGMFFNGYKWEPIESLNAPGQPSGNGPSGLPLGGIREMLIQQQQAMAAAQAQQE